MNFCSTLIVGLTILVVAASSTSIHRHKDNVRPTGGSGIHLGYIGSANGKALFADATEMRNWTASKEFCESNGLRFASITSQAQLQVLRDAFSVDDFYGHYWTSGRDSFAPRQFTWDTIDAQPDDDIVEIKDILVEGYQTCLEFHSFGPESQSHFDIEYCSFEQGVLCEDVN